MIVVDTSAIIAIIEQEPDGPRCLAALEANQPRMISAGTLSEALIVTARRDVQQEVWNLLNWYSFNVVPVTSDTAKFVGEIYQWWGKGFHPASLNFGDCFAYALAKDCDCPLLYIGNDFAQTDIASALA